jgi:predicted ribosome quality control (RQC) complex YloA/Tae2 family protein
MRAPAAFDSVVLAAVVRDLRPSVGSRVRRILQPAGFEIALELGGRDSPTILISVHARWARIHLSAGLERGEAAPFTQMLRARLEGARLHAIDQPPFERSVTMRFETDAGRSDLVAELMGRHSNLILVQDGVVAGAVKLIGRARSSVREVLPGRPFLPPPRDRHPPGEVDTGHLRAFLSATDVPLAQALTAVVLGIGPVMARELAVRAGLNPDGPAAAHVDAAAALHGALQDLATTVREEAFKPVLYLVDGLPAGYAPFPLEHLRSLPFTFAAAMSEAVAKVTGRLSVAGELDEQRRTLGAVIRTALRKTEHAEADLGRALEEADAGGVVRTRGELLLAYASQIPPGSTEAVLPGFDGEPVTVPLDPGLTSVENAQRLFDRYAKVRDARPQVEARLRAVHNDRRYLESMLAMVDTASGTDDLGELRRELADEGYLPQRRGPPAAPPKPRTFVLEGGAHLLAGRSNQDNDRVTFKAAGPDDLWFHARGVPGAHVILRTGGRAPTEAEIAAAASAAAYFSAARAAAHVAVDYTERKYVRKPRGSRPGMVTYERERTIQVAPSVPGS